MSVSGCKLWLLLILAGMLSGCSVAPPVSHPLQVLPARSPQQSTYLIDGESFTLVDGRAIMATAPGSASQTVVRLLREPVWGDLDGDGVPDAAVLLVQTTGGSGTFYFLAAALNRGGLFVGTRAVFIGDRIAPRQLTVRSGVIGFDYNDRRPGEPMSAAPTVARSKYLALQGESLMEIP